MIPLDLPSLRERQEDIPLLVDHFMRLALAKRGSAVDIKMSSEVLDVLMNYDWPGNVRELENAIERIVALSDGGLIQIDQLPERILVPRDITTVTQTKNLKEFVMEKENLHIQRILMETGGDKKKAARLLGIDLATLYRKIDRCKPQ